MIIVWIAKLIDAKEKKSKYSNTSIYIPPENNDITTMDIHQIKECGRFTPAERAAEYRRRGKSPSGILDGEYNDDFLEDGDEYNQFKGISPQLAARLFYKIRPRG
jgi:hypothetical protein